MELFSPITLDEAQAAVYRAIETWNRVGLSVHLVLVDQIDQLSIDRTSASELAADILIQWHFASSDPEELLSAQVHAHADYPGETSLFGGPPLPLHFNADLLWGTEIAGCYDVETVTLHELGHLLGLIYHSGPDTIMYDAIGPAPLFVRHALDWETVSRAQRLYESP
ncbi:MAG: matrixin family metalloprotease [Pirellulaceae bacterium]|nr:matrixin family metalloprotease [Pirellulaceae bacterium]